MSERLVRYALIVAVLLPVCSLAALLLSSRLQRFISEPICDLARTASSIARDKDYAIRAVKQTGDEVGQLIEPFNEMLSEIQKRDTALEEARNCLEKRVGERTRELRNEIEKHQRTAEALQAQEERTRLIIDHAFDAIISTDAQGQIIAWNTQAQNTFGWYAAEAVGRNFADMIMLPKFRQAHEEGLERLLATGEAHVFNKRIEIVGMHKDSHEVPIELAITPIRLTDGYIFNAFLREITERKQAEEALDDLNKQLMTATRKAGMSEIATNVLHNVGNVLNSVNISAEVVSENVRKFRVAGLRNLATLIREHAQNLPGFFAHDPRGRELPDYLSKLSEHLAEPQKAILQELESLKKNIEHIKEVVARQQSYARGAGVLERLSMSELMDDAIAINAAGFSRHGIALIREYSEVPPLVTDRHKVLQILVNLLNNAKDALEGASNERKLIVRSIVNGKGGVTIDIVDNGVGITPENLTRIFQHGFTTRISRGTIGLGDCPRHYGEESSRREIAAQPAARKHRHSGGWNRALYRSPASLRASLLTESERYRPPFLSISSIAALTEGRRLFVLAATNTAKTPAHLMPSREAVVPAFRSSVNSKSAGISFAN